MTMRFRKLTPGCLKPHNWDVGSFGSLCENDGGIEEYRGDAVDPIYILFTALILEFGNRLFYHRKNSKLFFSCFIFSKKTHNLDPLAHIFMI